MSNPARTLWGLIRGKKAAEGAKSMYEKKKEARQEELKSYGKSTDEKYAPYNLGTVKARMSADDWRKKKKKSRWARETKGHAFYKQGPYEPEFED